MGFVKGTYCLIRRLALLSFVSCISMQASAQIDPDVGTYVADYSKKISAARGMEPLDENLFGDEVNQYTGRVEFSVTDVNLPGNNALPVAFARRYQFDRWVAPGENGHRPAWKLGPLSDWDIELPYMHARFPLSPRLGWQTSSAGMRCSQPNKALAPPQVNSGYVPDDYWLGNFLYIPGKGQQELIFVETAAQRKAQGNYTYRWATKDGWYLSCLPTTANGVEGEAFLAHAPDGTRYWFNQFAGTVRSGEAALKRDGLRSGEVKILLTRVEDRFGNSVVYQYASDSDAKLLSITASDGRQLTMTYAGSHIKTVSDGTRTWTYTYGDWQLGTVNDENGFLWHVQQPDGAKWTYATTYAPGVVESDSPSCGNPSGFLYPGDMVFQATHPSGAQGRFVFNMRRHGRTYVPKACKIYSPTLVKEYVPTTFSTVSLSRKEISGPGMSARSWQWNYQNVAGRYDFECTGGCPASRTVTLTKPDGSSIRSQYGIKYGENDGLLLSSEQIDSDGANILSQLNNSYLLSPVGQNYEAGFGAIFRQYADPRIAYIQPIVSAQTIREGVTYEWSVPMCGSVRCFDEMARWTRALKFSSLGYSRSDLIEYHDDPVAWVTGQMRKRINLDTGMVELEAIYNAQSLPASILNFGKTVQSATYNADGTLSTFSDGTGNITSLSNWKRGIPQLIRYPGTPEAPDGATESATVNNSGWITSVTDETGAVTGYGYDAMGRLASIIQPTGDTLAAPSANGGYYNTIRNFRPLTATDWKPTGVLDGQWRLYEETGTRVNITYLDAMWRPILKHEYDAQNTSATLRASKISYDARGRVSFQSYPSSEVTPGNTGTRTFYDALDRVTSVEQDSEHGVLTTTTQYLSGLKTRVTNPKGFSTTTSFMAWDQPNYDFPILSEQPEGKVIQIGRHLQFGWPLQLTQRNASNTLSATRRYVYDDNALLCKSIEPETGATVTGYDGAGNPTWQAAGLDVGAYGSLTDCQYAGASNSGRVVTRQYDARNRLTHLIFPNGLGNQIWTYEKDNLPKSVTAYNNAGNTTPVVTTYAYNKRRLLVGETLAQPGWYSWSVGYAYDGYGHLSTQTYPTGLVVDYAPNPLGQPTKAGTYASGAQYYPNGALKQFTYGNGIVHTMIQNARQLPARSTSSGGALDLGYFYDNNGNVTHIADHGRGSNFHRWMEYDNLDRLTGAGSVNFGGDHWHRMTYDALDNLKSWKLAGVKDYAEYVYDAQNHRLTSIRNTAGATVVGFAYDPQGNLQNKNGQSYQFDFGNRLRDVPGKENYRYDGLGRRILAWQYPTPAKPSGTVTLSQYTQSGQIIYQEDHDRSTAMEHIYLAGSIIATREPNWATGQIGLKYQHTDALGSPVAVTNASGQVIERMDYEPWGAIIGKPNHNGIGYTGHVMDGATGLTYMQQRYYDQSVGRFLSVDPVTANSDSGVNFNRYWYADNSPYRYKDPDGRARCGIMNMGSDACDLVGSILESIRGLVKSTTAVGAAEEPVTLDTIVVVGRRLPALQPSVAPVRPVPTWTVVGGVASRLWGPMLLLWPTEIAAPACEMPGGPPCGMAMSGSFPAGFWPGDEGGEEWGRRNGVGSKEGRRRFHGIKQDDKGQGGGRGRDKYGVNPDTGEVCNPEGEIVGDLNNP